jgi:hypothetical protein
MNRKAPGYFLPRSLVFVVQGAGTQAMTAKWGTSIARKAAEFFLDEESKVYKY